MVTFSVNGKTHEFNGDPTTPVLWYLRDELNLTGPKFGCGMAQCGACTVHIDGTAQRSCVLPLAAVAGKKITTIEGLSKDGEHPVQQAWVEHKVPQCGFCQCGQMMQAASLLASNSNPSDDEIVANMSGNICRCGTYPRIHKAIKSAAKTMSANNGVNYFNPNDTEASA
ncbi:2Fe-2S iron-sulfur cluster binding domain-containing protein [Alteromonas sp. 345S023]|uniref:2Fe-2S iron-sulfur cluster binding domain-containing protein n=1 Tax=Alteromonas profundi TaxID=2696062 RepID=A0A7X5LMI6_9ALTE|nr:(2Fe-2S)-binding protein [Alteromonas profundi]NDV91654.1 2Fe-2S iron-sulfur cluster binding domain-containing protein [Alteromonas profundi]